MPEDTPNAHGVAGCTCKLFDPVVENQNAAPVAQAQRPVQRRIPNILQHPLVIKVGLCLRLLWCLIVIVGSLANIILDIKRDFEISSK